MAGTGVSNGNYHVDGPNGDTYTYSQMSGHNHANTYGQLNGREHSNGQTNGQNSEDKHQGQDKIEPIAIIGFSLTFPDTATTAESFWTLLMDGRNVAGPFPEDRVNASAFYHPDGDRLDSVAVPGGHFIKQNIAVFDAPFFSLSAAEASAMDPQARMMLETSYRALENAGIPMEDARGSKTSVYTGCFTDDYKISYVKDAEAGSKYALVGISPSMLSGRLSWAFDFSGPSATIDTACSSSLVALDLGCESLLSRKADMSMVTGCNLIIGEETIHALGNMSMLSPDGRSYSFDARGNGYGRGEGICAVILKRFDDAVRDGDTIRGIIRSSGTNQDGRTPGISQPNKEAQASLIEDVYARAGLDMSKTRYFEAHGTGTPIGDPLEAEAISSAFRHARKDGEPIYVGAVKSNVGHLEGSSGIAAVLKTLLVLERGIIPPNADLGTVNPKINEKVLNIKFPREAMAWPTRNLRRASVNSFGASGTNAHVVMDDVYHFLTQRNIKARHRTVEYPESITLDRTMNYPPIDKTFSIPKMFTISATDKDTLSQMVDLYRKYVEEAVDLDINGLLYTLNTRRSLFPWRSFAMLDASRLIGSTQLSFSEPSRTVSKPKSAWVFTGQGAQWARMGIELLAYPVFRDSLLKADDYFRSLGSEWSLLNELSKDKMSSRIDQPTLSQPVCTALQVALVDLLHHFRMNPSAVVGHSSGEIAAAYCSGSISQEAAWKISYFRGTYSATLVGNNGTMMAVGMSEAEIKPLIKQVSMQFPRGDLVVACVNSPVSITVSGSVEHIEALRLRLEEYRVFARRLKVSVAYHSQHMNLIAEQYRASIRGISKGERANHAPIMVSSVTGQKVTSNELCQSDYWVHNLISPVQFVKAFEQLCHEPEGEDERPTVLRDINTIVEVGPHSALWGPIKDILATIPHGEKFTYQSCLTRGISATNSLVGTLGRLHCRGISFDLGRVNYLVDGREPMTPLLADLPEYPFNHLRTYWHEGRISREGRFRRHAKLDLLGKPIIDWNPREARWRNFLKISEVPWVESHKINDTVIYPGAGMLVMAIEAANQIADKSREVIGFRIQHAKFINALRVPSTPEGIETQVSLLKIRDSDNKRISESKFHIYTHERGQWNENCSGTIQIHYKHQQFEVDEMDEARKQVDVYRQRLEDILPFCTKLMGTSEFYSKAWKFGVMLGPHFHTLNTIQFSETHSYADINCYEWPSNGPKNPPQEHIIHPITLDCMFQTSVAYLVDKGTYPTAIPNGIRSLWVSKQGLSMPSTKSLKVLMEASKMDNRGFESSIFSSSQALDKIHVEVDGLRWQFVSGSTSGTKNTRQLCYSMIRMPDIDLMTGDQVASFCREPVVPHLGMNEPQINGVTHSSDVRDNYKPLAKYLRAVFFKNPRLRILQIISKSGDWVPPLTDLIMDQNSCRAQWDTWVIASLLQTTPDQSLGSLREHKGFHFQAWNPENDALAQGLEAGSFDILLIDETFDTPEAANMTFQNLKKLLKPFGKLILVNHNACDMRNHANGTVSSSYKNDITNTSLTKVELGAALSKSGFSGIVADLRSSAAIPDQAYSIIITKTALARPVSSETFRTLLIVDSGSTYQNEVACLVQACLKSEGHTVGQVVPFDSLTSEPNFHRTLCIFFMELERTCLKDLEPLTFEIFRKVLSTSKGVLWLSSCGSDLNIIPEASIIDGMARATRLENEFLKFVSVKLGAQGQNPKHQAESIYKIMDSIDVQSTSQIYEPSYLEIEGRFLISRLIDTSLVSKSIYSRTLARQSQIQAFGIGPPLKLAIGVTGMLDTLHFVEDLKVLEPLPPDEVEIKVHAVGVNFKDLLQALGWVNGTTFGNECAGVIHRAGQDSSFKPGEKVCLSTTAAYGTFTRAKAAAVARVPQGMSLTEAAAIPTQFGAAYGAIHHLARMQRGESILVHSGAGGTGQAAIQLAKLLDATIFTTVGSNDKKEFLIKEYGIPEDHIFNSRDTLFAKSIKRLTDNRGVDVILNTVPDEGLLASWNCIAPYGRFVELGRKDIQSNANLPMGPFLRNASFHFFEGSIIATERPELSRSILESVLSLFSQDKIHIPKPLQILSISEVQEAMRMVQSGNTIGKLVLEITDDAMVSKVLHTKPNFNLSTDSTYLIAGGLGGLGKSAAKWLTERGARNLILLSRSGANNDSKQIFIKGLNDLGARVFAPKCDITDESNVRSVIEEASRTMPPIKGCIQGTSILQDALLANMTLEEWNLAARSKIQGSWNLHSLLPDNLDFFIFLSSISGVFGTRGQANYAAGNAYMDGLAHYRVTHGQKAIALNLGPMVDDGMLADDPELKDKALAPGHVAPVSRAEFHAILDFYCSPSLEVLSEDECQVVYGIQRPATMRSRGLHLGQHMTLPLFDHIFQIDIDDNEDNGMGDAATRSNKQLFAASSSFSEAAIVVYKAMVARLAPNFPGLVDNHDSEKSLHSYGMDSLVAIELRAWFANEFGADVAIFEILGESSLVEFSRLVAEKSSFKQTAWAG